MIRNRKRFVNGLLPEFLHHVDTEALEHLSDGRDMAPKEDGL